MKRTGRPRVDEDDDSVAVYVTMPSRQYDRLCEAAKRERTSVPEVIRRQLRKGDDKKEKETS